MLINAKEMSERKGAAHIYIIVLYGLFWAAMQISHHIIFSNEIIQMK